MMTSLGAPAVNRTGAEPPQCIFTTTTPRVSFRFYGVAGNAGGFYVGHSIRSLAETALVIIVHCCQATDSTWDQNLEKTFFPGTSGAFLGSVQSVQTEDPGGFIGADAKQELRFMFTKPDELQQTYLPA